MELHSGTFNPEDFRLARANVNTCGGSAHS
ncbi:Uncharacterised protein [Salmonella bongori]|nr:Uncharacterised protein [Salmonella bongori]